MTKTIIKKIFMSKMKPLDGIFKKRSYESWDQIPSSLTKNLHDLSGTPIPLSIALKRTIKTGAPALLSARKVVVGDLIPFTSWGSSLANLLTRESWNMLRRPIISGHHNVCELCGSRLNSLDVHEVWSYDFPKAIKESKRKKTTRFGIQKLEGLMAICNDCHRCFHLGREKSQGTLPETLQRLAALNNWTTQEVSTYYDTIINRWEMTSSVNWLLDLGILDHPDGHLTVSTPWKIHPEDGLDCLITKPSDFGEPSLTVLLNTAWKFASESRVRQPLSISECGYHSI
jgi:hypothetical protein